MAFSILDSSVRAAVNAAYAAPDGSREAGVVNAVYAPFGASNVLVRLYASGDVLLTTVTCGAWSMVTTGPLKSMTLGAIASYAHASDGTPTKAVFATAAGSPVFSCSAGVGSGDIALLSAVASGVPFSLGTVRFTANAALDSDAPTVGNFWDSSPADVTMLAGESADLTADITAGSVGLMVYSAPPSGVYVSRRNILSSLTATAGTGNLDIGPDDWGYALEGDDTAVVSDSLNYRSGMTWTTFNRSLGMDWSIAGGTWVNDRFEPQSATSTVPATALFNNSQNRIAWNVTYAVERWADDIQKNYGLILKAENGYCTFHSREAAANLAPTLTITYADLTTRALVADVDVSLSAGTDNPNAGASIQLEGGSTEIRIYLYWRLTSAIFDRPILSASLALTTTIHTGSTQAVVTHPMLVTRPQSYAGQPASSTGKTLTWSAGSYAGSDADVIFATQFPGIVNAASRPAWTSSVLLRSITDGQVVSIDSSYSGNGISLPSTSAHGLLVRFAPGAGESAQVAPFEFVYPFAKASNNWTGRDTVYVHYRVICGTDWICSDGGKWIGFTGQISLCGARDLNGAALPINGNGGAKADATGWSARGSFERTPKGWSSISSAPVRSFGGYIYHQDTAGNFGDGVTATGHPAGILTAGRAYDIDLQCTINTAGVADGIWRMWVDDWLVINRTDFKFRPANVSPILVDPNVPGSSYNLNIAGVWVPLYYGGVEAIPAGEGGHVAITDFVVSTARIGRQAR